VLFARSGRRSACQWGQSVGVRIGRCRSR